MKYIKVFYTGLIGLLLAACTNDTFYSEKEEGTGYLRLALGSIDVELSSTSRAEVVSLPDDLIPQTADFMIDIRQGNSSVEGFPKKYSELTEEGIELMAGGYTVTAYYGANEPIQATPYFAGTSTVEIYPGKEAEAKIEAALANAILVPSVSTSLQNHYKDWTLTVKVDEDEIKLADNENTDGCLFVQAGQSAKAVFKGTNIIENNTLHEWTIFPSAAAQTKYVIQCDPDIPVFSFGLNAVAEHTTDQSGYLNGTKVSLSFGDLSNVPLSLISNWKATLVNATGEIVRSYTTNNFTNTGEMTIENDWSYLPQGNYTLRYSYIIDGNEVSEETTANEAKTVTMPMPTFEAAVSAQTSYSVYTSQGAAAANETDGSGIFDIATTTTISPDILNNEKYRDLLSITYSLDSGESSTEESPVFQNLQWGTRKLTAFALFDGGNATASMECEVTGIPYKGDYTSKSPFDDSVNPWISVGSGEYWGDVGYILFQYSGAFSTSIKYNSYVFSPTFQVPTMVDVSYSTKVIYFTTGATGNSIDIYTGVSKETDNNVKDKTTSISRIFVAAGQKPKDDQFTIISDNTQIGNNYRVCISHNSNASRNWADNWVIFKSLDVLYR
ncbi:DUF4493 domain-containing protein [Phocaeicola barnesiae]|uniref:DUF4493 domain-containing protein n=1 Tax=Phocaeicola barnesiae TaxID=376804 RepID=UPI0025A34EA6|nr:DUF4493 domain-containing protein [Phocaeicola barnesiae]MDM8240863.1 DUF4493 domain-containing protein [Phocaeicola barnesiae]